ncbi:MAG: UDP-3-O-(3-hydroxymyristoyl)glucosamine N-acyltransferase [Pseudomonadota bacterium]
MAFIISDLAKALGAELLGDGSLQVLRLAEPAMAGADDLALAVAPKFADQLKDSAAQAAVVWPGADIDALGLRAAIIAPRGRLAMAGLTREMDRDLGLGGVAGINDSAIIDPTATIGPDVSIGPFAVIGPEVKIEAGARIGPHVSIGAESVIGAGTDLHAGVRIGPSVQIGKRCVLHFNAAIGADGFSFTTEGPSGVERAVRQRGEAPLDPPDDGTWHKIYSLGGVVIDDDVEVGANSTVDAGTIRPTRVGRGSKIDNLVQVGHNVVVGEDCLLCAQAAVAGSTVLGDRVILGGKSGVADNLMVGRDVVAGGGAIVLSNVADGVFVSGHPAQPTHEHRAGLKALRRLVKGER